MLNFCVEVFRERRDTILNSRCDWPVVSLFRVKKKTDVPIDTNEASGQGAAPVCVVSLARHCHTKQNISLILLISPAFACDLMSIWLL